ncbi:MAG: sulfatase/phosphatase domain-containing protein, partial [Planctomycetota bacterium]
HWPAKNVTGRDVKPITAHVDVLPTLIDLCGIEAPADVRFDGRSIAPLVFGSKDDWPDRILITDSQRVKDPIKWRKSAVMTSRWRLNNQLELYDIKMDPGQKKNVAQQHPDVVGRLQAFYDQWWAELEPTFQQSTAIYLGHPQDNPARLTSHDWITTKSTPWNQRHVRQALNGQGNVGFWNVHVYQSGRYKIRLRRWPEEADAAIADELAAGDPVPGERAFRDQLGVGIQPVRATVKIGDKTQTLDVGDQAKETMFEIDLDQGTTRMEATFETSSGEVYGAFYAYVEKQ